MGQGNRFRVLSVLHLACKDQTRKWSMHLQMEEKTFNL